MLLSKRRLKWGGLIVLLGLVAVYFRPPRSWIDYAVMKQFDGDLQVGQVHYHRGNSVLELRRVNWSKYADGCAFGLSAERAWLAIEAEPILDRKFIIPRGEIPDATLFLNAASSPSESLPVWQEKLTAFLAQIDWTALLDRYSRLIDSEGSGNRIRAQLDGWLADSQRNQEQIDQITGSLSNKGNPLREEAELRSKLQKVDALVSQQQSMMQGVEKLSSAERQRVENLQVQLSLDSQERTRALILRDDLQDWETEISQALVIQLARDVWAHWGQCGRIAHLVASKMPAWERASYDQDVSIGDADSRFFSLNDLLVSGQFSGGQFDMPFQLLVDATTYQNESSLSGDWRLRFDSEDAWSQVHLSQKAKDDISRLEMRVFSKSTESTKAAEQSTQIDATPSPSDRAYDENEAVAESVAVWEDEEPVTGNKLDVRALKDGWPEGSNFMVDIHLDNHGHNLRGQMNLTAEVASAALGESGLLFQQALQKSGGTPLCFSVEIGGTWQQPRFEVAEGMPNWLERAIKSQIREQIVDVNSYADADLRKAFERQVGEHLASVERTVGSAEVVLQQHQQRLLEARSALQRRIDELAGVAFTAYRNDEFTPPTEQR